MNSAYAEIAARLTESLTLQQPPVAVCFADSVPAGVDRYAGRAPAGCKFWEEAANATFATAAADHGLCAIGMYTHNLESSAPQREDLQDALRVFADLGYLSGRDLPFVPVLNVQPKFVVYSPLAESPRPPDVVLLFVNTSQALIVSEAVQQVESHLPPAMGRPACAVISQVMNSGRAALSAGCCGARAYLDVFTDEVALFALPGAKVATYAERISALSQANSVLAKFHQLRRRDVLAGKSPTVKESLAVLQSHSASSAD